MKFFDINVYLLFVSRIIIIFNLWVSLQEPFCFLFWTWETSSSPMSCASCLLRDSLYFWLCNYIWKSDSIQPLCILSPLSTSFENRHHPFPASIVKQINVSPISQWSFCFLLITPVSFLVWVVLALYLQCPQITFHFIISSLISGLDVLLTVLISEIKWYLKTKNLMFLT